MGKQYSNSFIRREQLSLKKIVTKKSPIKEKTQIKGKINSKNSEQYDTNQKEIINQNVNSNDILYDIMNNIPEDIQNMIGLYLNVNVLLQLLKDESCKLNYYKNKNSRIYKLIFNTFVSKDIIYNYNFDYYYILNLIYNDTKNISIYEMNKYAIDHNYFLMNDNLNKWISKKNIELEKNRVENARHMWESVNSQNQQIIKSKGRSRSR